MIDKKFKAKWLKALRSRKFKQGHMALHNSEGYCCLGVACVVAGAEEREPTYGSDKAFVYGGDRNSSVLPDALREEIGLTTEEQEILYMLNDGGFRKDKEMKPHKFGQIARWIERHL
jgi:hypothetical protein